MPSFHSSLLMGLLLSVHQHVLFSKILPALCTIYGMVFLQHMRALQINGSHEPWRMAAALQARIWQYILQQKTWIVHHLRCSILRRFCGLASSASVPSLLAEGAELCFSSFAMPLLGFLILHICCNKASWSMGVMAGTPGVCAS